MFQEINEQVNQQLEKQGTFTPKADANDGNASGSQPIAPVEPTAEQAELARLRQENVELKQRQLEADRDARIKSAVASVNVHDNGPTAGEMSVRRQRAITQAGGVAKWYKIPIADRVNIQTDGNYIPVKDSELAKFFGPKSSAVESARLKSSDPRRFRAYKATAIELGWIG